MHHWMKEVLAPVNTLIIIHAKYHTHRSLSGPQRSNSLSSKVSTSQLPSIC